MVKTSISASAKKKALARIKAQKKAKKKKEESTRAKANVGSAASFLSGLNIPGVRRTQQNKKMWNKAK